MNTCIYLHNEFIEETFFLFKHKFPCVSGVFHCEIIHSGFLHLKSLHFGLHEEQQAEDEKKNLRLEPNRTINRPICWPNLSICLIF